MHNIPVTIVDNFLDNPQMWIDLANQCEYAPARTGNWPGVRSKPLNEVDPVAFDILCKKFFALFYDGKQEQIGWSVDARFQKIKPGEGEGWVHVDECKVSCIVYLTPDASPESGTSIYEPLSICTTKFEDVKYNLFKGNVDDKFASKFREQNNEQYRESIRVGNKYNRLVAFDGHLPHRANAYDTGSAERLTLVFFINAIHAHHTPIERMKRA